MELARWGLRGIVFLITWCCLGSCVGLVGVSSGGGGREVVYTPAGWPEDVKGTVFKPEPGGTTTPAILLIHGGVKLGEDGRWVMNRIARKLAARGYYVFNVTYRGVTKSRYPAQLMDIGAAMDWMKRNAGAEGFDVDRVGIFGYSAGGYLGSLAGLTGDGGLRVKAIVTGSAPSDLLVYEKGRLVYDHLGGAEEGYGWRIDEASPVMHVDGGSPPYFMYHGLDDKLVKPEHTRFMSRALERAGVEHEEFWIPGKGHIGAFFSSGGAVDRAIDFLDRHLKGVGRL